MHKSVLTEIFEDCWKHHIINVNILLFDPDQLQVNVYTFFPYTPTSCEHITSTLLMTMTNQSLRYSFFPQKLQNFHGCPLWLCTYTIPPYMILKQKPDGSYFTQGIEGEFYQALSTTLNFSPMVRVGHEKYLGGAKENFHMLRRQRVNLTMFAIVNTPQRSQEFTASFPYTYSAVVFTIPQGPPYSPLEKLALPFEPLVWVCVFIISATACAVIIYTYGLSRKWQKFTFGDRNDHPLLNYINMTLGGVVTQPPTRNFARTIFTIWLFGSLVLRSSYQGALFSFIQSRRSAVQIDSLEKLAQFNYTIYSSEQILQLLEIGSPHLSGRFVLTSFPHVIQKLMTKYVFH